MLRYLAYGANRKDKKPKIFSTIEREMAAFALYFKDNYLTDLAKILGPRKFISGLCKANRGNICPNRKEGLTDENIQSILKIIPQDTLKGLRFACFLTLSYETMIRGSELVN